MSDHLNSIAAKIASDLMVPEYQGGCLMGDPTRAIRMIEEALVRAVEEERAVCAQVAKHYANQCNIHADLMDSQEGKFAWERIARNADKIAALILARADQQRTEG